MGLATISLVGYTNAGKTSLYNFLTHKKNLVENSLFATLDSTVGRIYIPQLGREIMVSDTIGFIRDLPSDLIDAFRSTLLESVHADVVLHVIDVSDPDMISKTQVVMEILADLKIPEEKIIAVYNKIDLAGNLDKQKIIGRSLTSPCVFISTKTHDGIDTLLSEVLTRFKKQGINL